VTATLAKAARAIAVPDIPGISARAIRRVLTEMAQIAQIDGTFRYGLRGSKVAQLADFSLSVVRRAQRWLVEHGYLEKVEVGGGRKSTRWRIVLGQLVEHLPTPHPGHAPRPAAAQPPGGRDTTLERAPDVRRRSWPWSRPEPVVPSFPPPITDVCEAHGSAGGVLPDGITPRCPSCRRYVERFRT
jgi:hypothetical protein